MINAGVRWEPYFPIYSKRRQVTHFDRELFAQGVHSRVYTKAPVGLLFPGDPGMPGRSMGYSRWLDFAPRVGLAWDPTGRGVMTVRAAYGLFYDQPHLWLPWGFSQSPPFGTGPQALAARAVLVQYVSKGHPDAAPLERGIPHSHSEGQQTCSDR